MIETTATGEFQASETGRSDMEKVAEKEVRDGTG